MPELINSVASQALGQKTSLTEDWSGGDFVEELGVRADQNGLRVFVVLGNLGLGIASDAGGAVLNAQAEPASRLFAMGPPLRGMWWESTAVTDVALQAKALAQRLVML